MLTFINEINILIAPMGALLLVAIDYARNPAADSIQRKCMLLITCSAILTMLAEMITDIYSGRPGQTAHQIVYAACVVFFIFQLLAFSAIPLFIDYHVNRDVKRLKTLAMILGFVFVANLVALLLNIGHDFYFLVTDDNVYVRGTWHFLRVARRIWYS